MDGLIILLVLVALAFPVIAIVALVIAIGAQGRVETLERRFAALEWPRAQGPATTAATPPATAAASAPPPRPAAPQPAAAAPASVTAPTEAPIPAPAPAPPRAPTAVPPTAPPPPAPPTISLEERFGTRWVVWVGGVALALGGFFLVRYSIEQDLIGPGVRVFLGGLLAAALIAAGEWTRRTERLSGLASLPTAHIPGILTAAGTAVAYATVYAAYAL